MYVQELRSPIKLDSFLKNILVWGEENMVTDKDNNPYVSS